MKSASSTVERTSEEDIIRILVEQAPVGVSIVQDGKFCYINSYFSIATGYTTDELLGKDSFMLIVPEDRETVRENTVKMLKSVFTTPYQFRVTCKNGSIIWVMATVKSIQYHGKQAILGNYMEITGRRQVEQELQSERNKLQSVVDAMEDGLTIQDRDFNIIYQARVQRAIVGDHLGEKCYRVYEGREKICDGCPVEKAFKDGKSHIAEKSMVEPSGKISFWENTANPIRDASGEIVSCLEINRNITERKKQEQALADELTQRRLLIDKSLDGIVVLDEDARVVEANQCFADMLGYSLEEVHGLHTWDWDKNFPAEKILEMGRNVDEKGLHLETKHTRKDGSIIDVDISISAAMCSGRRLIFCIQRDVTERNRAEEKLTLLSSVTRQVSDATMVADPNFNIIYVNEAAQHLFRYSTEQMLGKHLDYFNAGLVPTELDQEIQHTISSGKVWVGLLTKKRKDGSTFLGECHITPLYGEDGRISSYVDVLRDVTERNRAEEALKESEERYKELANSITDVFFAMDEYLRYTYWNKASELLTGIRAEDAIGKSLLEIFPDSPGRRKAEKVYRAVLKTQKSQTFTNRFDIDGKHHIFEITAYPSQGGISVFVRDITESKEGEERLRQSEERYRTILEEMEDAYFEVDLGGHFTFFNDSVCRDLGYSSEELMGMSYKEYTVEEDIESLFRVFNKVYETGLPNKGFPWRTVRKDGSHGFAETSISAIHDGNNEIIGFRGVGRDITERQQSEERLRQSKENYRALFDSSVIGAVLVDAETMQMVMANQAAMRMFGFSSAATGLSPLDFVPPEDKQKDLELIVKEIFEKDSRKSIDLPAITKDGRKIWVSATGAKIMHKGRLAALFSFTDITERKQAEKALRQSEENYRALFDSSVTGTFVLDAETMKIQMANQAAAKMFGFSSVEEAIGLDPLDFVHTDEKERVLNLIMVELFEQDSRRTFDIRAITRDKRELWLSATGAAIVHGGKSAGLISFADITERKQAEEALRQNEENYRALFDSSVIGTIVLDADTLKVVIANRAATEMFGFSSLEEVQGIDPLDYIRPEDRERIIKLALDNLSGENTQELVELGAFTKDRKEIWISATGARITHEGKLAGLISFTDITEQKQQNERLMMTDRLASLGELASGAAHELNNPLTSIIGFSQLLMETEVPEDIREELKLINNEARRAVIVTNNFLSFARKHSSTKELNQINNIIEDVLELRAHEHEVNHIDVERHLSTNLPEVMVDYFQMQQVFMNIIINAEYFMVKMHNKGTLTITTEKQNSTARISFTDDGPGITEENLGRIFDPFFTTKETGSGTGLGLSICHGIVNEHGGRIYAMSQLGKGTTIVVELPIKKLARIKSLL